MNFNQSLSLYIPRVFNNFTRDDIANIFKKLHLGQVSRVDFVEKVGNDGQFFNSVYIHFAYWFDTITVRNFQERVVNPGKEARLVYDDPWYWIVLENKTTKKDPNQPRIRIHLDTPLKSTPAVITPNAPKKEKQITNVPIEYSIIDPCGLDVEFDETAAEMDEIAATEMDEIAAEMDEMDEIDYILEEDNKYLVTIDSRYVKAIEDENRWLALEMNVVQNYLNNNTPLHYWYGNFDN
jgi:hypothetical protein